MAGLVPAIHVFAAKTWMPGTRPRLSGTDCASCRVLQGEASSGCAAALGRPGGGRLKIECGLAWCWARRGWFLEKSGNRSPMHEIGVDQSGEGERTFDNLVGVVCQPQQDESNKGDRH